MEAVDCTAASVVPVLDVTFVFACVRFDAFVVLSAARENLCGSPREGEDWVDGGSATWTLCAEVGPSSGELKGDNGVC